MVGYGRKQGGDTSPRSYSCPGERELFEAALERLIRNKEFARRRGKHDYPLRGVVFCGKCGRRMVGTSRRSYRRYRCPHCRLVVIADKLEAGVWEKVLSMLSSPGLIRAEVEKTQGNAQGVGLEARLARVEARLRAL